MTGATYPPRPDESGAISDAPPPAPRRSRVLWAVSAIVLVLLLAGLVVFFVAPVIEARHRHTLTVDITSTTSSGCTPPGTPSAPDLASLAQNTFTVTEADTENALAVAQSHQLVDPCHLRLVFEVPGSAGLVDVVDETQSDLRWGPIDLQQVAGQGWTVQLSAAG